MILLPRLTRVLAASALSASLLVGGMSSMGCKNMMGHDNAADMSTKSLYDRLGGEPAITAVVDDFVSRAASDPQVNFTRKGHPNEWDPSAGNNMAKFKKHLVQFIEVAAGGPQKYEGRDMVTVHTGMGITRGRVERHRGGSDSVAGQVQGSRKGERRASCRRWRDPRSDRRPVRSWFITLTPSPSDSDLRVRRGYSAGSKPRPAYC